MPGERRATRTGAARSFNLRPRPTRPTRPLASTRPSTRLKITPTGTRTVRRRRRGGVGGRLHEEGTSRKRASRVVSPLLAFRPGPHLAFLARHHQVLQRPQHHRDRCAVCCGNVPSLLAAAECRRPRLLFPSQRTRRWPPTRGPRCWTTRRSRRSPRRTTSRPARCVTLLRWLSPAQTQLLSFGVSSGRARHGHPAGLAALEPQHHGQPWHCHSALANAQPHGREP